MNKICAGLCLLICISLTLSSCKPSAPMDIEGEIKAQALKQWQDKKFGMFIHWGLFALPAGIWKGQKIPYYAEQIMNHARIPQAEYETLLPLFDPTEFDPDLWVQLAKQGGMQYMIFTAKHHDGFNMYDSQHSDYSVVKATPYKKDILKGLSQACQKAGFPFGIYYSTPDWHFPGSIKRPEPDPATTALEVENQVYSPWEPVTEAHENYIVSQLRELLTGYGDFIEIFFDMGEPTFAQSHRFAEMVRKLQPACLISGRIMNDQGDFLTMPDNALPEVPIEQAWETPASLYNSWGYKSWEERPPLERQVREQVRRLSQVVSRGGNFLLNIGPKADGSLLEYEIQVLQTLGRWMFTHGEAIYNTKPNPFKKLIWGECTHIPGALFLHIHEWPESGILRIPGLKNRVIQAHFLGEKSQRKILWSRQQNDVWLQLPVDAISPYLPIIRLDYTDPLAIVDPLVIPDADGRLRLAGDLAIRQGKYSGADYFSIIKDHTRSWDIRIPADGRYEAVLRLKTSPQHTGQEILGFELAYEHGVKSFKLDLKANKSGHFVTEIGTIFLKRSERYTLVFRRSGQARSVDLDLEAIELIPIQDNDIRPSH